MPKVFVSLDDNIWIAEDGTYGSDRIIVVNTSNWTSEDFQKLDDAPNSLKQATAVEIDRERNK